MIKFTKQRTGVNFRIYKKNYVCNLRNSVNQWMTKDEIIYIFFISVSFFSALFIDVCSVCMLGHVYFCACMLQWSIFSALTHCGLH